MGNQDREHLSRISCSCSYFLCYPPSPLQVSVLRPGMYEGYEQMGIVDYSLPSENQKASPRNAPSLLTPTTPYLLAQSNDLIHYNLPIFPTSNLACLSSFPVTFRMSQDSPSCQKILLQTVICVVSAALRREISCSLLIPLSRHLFHHIARRQSLYVQ